MPQIINEKGRMHSNNFSSYLTRLNGQIDAAKANNNIVSAGYNNGSGGGGILYSPRQLEYQPLNLNYIYNQDNFSTTENNGNVLEEEGRTRSKTTIDMKKSSLIR